jgi:hypothetical protein
MSARWVVQVPTSASLKQARSVLFDSDDDDDDGGGGGGIFG